MTTILQKKIEDQIFKLIYSYLIKVIKNSNSKITTF